MKKFFAALTLAFLLSGCNSLIPKRVELGQDKVEKMPVAKSSERETQRQAAQRAAEKSDQTLRAAILVDAPDIVTDPAAESAVLTKSISGSVGPPLNPANPSLTSAALAQKLDASVAKLNSRIDEFREDNDKNAGHKIENTGFLQVPYFAWAGGALILFVILFVVAGLGWTALKAYGMSNPPVALGLKAVQAGGSLAAKAVGQLVGGGEKFRGWLKTELPHVSDEVKAQVEELFKSAHKETSDEKVRAIVNELTGK